MTDRAIRLTAEDIARGWVPLACGEHAFVFRASVLAQLPADAQAWCDGIGGWAVPLAVIRGTEADADGREEAGA